MLEITDTDREYLSGKAFSTIYHFGIRGFSKPKTRLEWLVPIVANKRVIHFGCVDHLSIVEQRRKEKAEQAAAEARAAEEAAARAAAEAQHQRHPHGLAAAGAVVKHHQHGCQHAADRQRPFLGHSIHSSGLGARGRVD